MLWIAKREGRRWMRKVVTKSTVPPLQYTSTVPRVPTRRDCLSGSHCTTGVVNAPDSGGRKRREGTLRRKQSNANQTTLRQSPLPAFLRVNTWIIVKQVAGGWF